MTTSSTMSSLLRSASPLALVAVVSVSLIGCSQNPLVQAGPNFDLVNPAERHPILVSQKPTTMTISVPRGSSGLSPKARADVVSFSQRVGSDASDSRLVIQAPSGAANDVATAAAVHEIRDLLVSSGHAESSVIVEAYQAGGDRQPPVKVSYLRYVAEGPECGHWPTNLAYEPNNLPMHNLGCANQKNFAAMVVNPGDLIGPRAVTARPGERRDVVWDKYQKGEDTASRKAEDGKVSTQGGN